MSKKKIMIIVPVIVALFILAGCFAANSIFGTREKVSYNIEGWTNLEKQFAYLPSIEELGVYTDLNCKHLHRDSFIFQSDAYTLRATYSEESFIKQKEHIQHSHLFQNTVVDYGEETVEKETVFQLDGFEFQMLSLKEYNLDYPKQIVFVGVSEARNEIAFVYFYDMDLDYIGRSFADFLVEECGWE